MINHQRDSSLRLVFVSEENVCNSNPLEATKAICDEIAPHDDHTLVQYKQCSKWTNSSACIIFIWLKTTHEIAQTGINNNAI